MMLLMGAGAALADITENMGVSATVASACSFGTAPTMAFGTYDPTANAAKPGTATIALTCTLSQSVSIGLDNGQTYASATRNMINGANDLKYGLYSDSGHSTAWGTGGSAVTYVGTGSADTQTV